MGKLEGQSQEEEFDQGPGSSMNRKPDATLRLKKVEGWGLRSRMG